MRLLVQLMGWLLPQSWRKKLYEASFGWRFGEKTYIGRSLLSCQQLTMGDFSYIGNLNVVRSIDALVLHEHSRLGHLNWITGYPTRLKKSFSQIKNRKCELKIGNHSAITSRHFIDCTGGIVIGDFSTIGGVRSQFLTHYIDIYESCQTCKPIRVGRYCFVGTGALLLPGSCLPDYSVLGGGSVLVSSQETPYSLYAGNPAVLKKRLLNCDVDYFKRVVGVVS